MEVTENLRFIDLAVSGCLSHVGADARLLSGSYKVAQQWSAALRNHPCKPDGIRYLSRHDPTRIAYAIYTRAPSSFKVSSLGSLMDLVDRALLNQLLTDYQVDLI
jgi:RES domain